MKKVIKIVRVDSLEEANEYLANSYWELLEIVKERIDNSDRVHYLLGETTDAFKILDELIKEESN